MVKVSDLKNQTGECGSRPFLLCLECRSESSANASDYFFMSPDEVFECCGTEMRLVTKKVSYVEVTK